MSLWEQRVTMARRLWSNGDLAAAEQELRTVLDDGDFDAAAHAACLLGGLLDERGDHEQARAMHQRTIDSGHPIYAQLAAISLGLLLFDADDLIAAQAVLRFAAEGADPDAAGRADALLAQVLHMLGDVEGAREARERAMTSSDPGVVEIAGELELPAPGERSTDQYLQVAYEQACSLLEQGREHDAEPILRRLLDSGHPNYGSLGAAKLYALHADDQSIARQMAERIISYRHPEHLGWGHVLLGGVLEDSGDAAAAAEAFRSAADDPRPNIRLHALIHLGMQLRALGRPDQAREIYQRVINTRHPHFSVEALGVLAELQRDEGDIAGAIETFGRVEASGHSGKAPLAAYNLGALQYEHGDAEAAIAAFRRAAQAEDPRVAHQAELALSMVDVMDAQQDPAGEDAKQLAMRAHQAAGAGDMDAARLAYQQVIDMDARMWSVMAANSLGLLEAVSGETEQARRTLQRASTAEDASLVQDAIFRRALVEEPAAGPVLEALFRLEHNEDGGLDRLVEGGEPQVRDLALLVQAELLLTSDVTAAVELLGPLTDSPNRLVRTKSGQLLAAWLVREQRTDDAVRLLERIVADGHPMLLPWSAAQLGHLLVEHGEPEDVIAAFATAAAAGYPSLLGEVFGKLAMLYRVAGHDEDLKALYRTTMASGHPELAPRAAYLLGEELVHAYDLDGALKCFDRAAGTDSEVAALAAFGAHAIRRDLDSSRAVLAELDDVRLHNATELCMDLARQSQANGDAEFTEWALSLLAEAGAPDRQPEALLYLGALRNETGDVAGAREAWEEAAREGVPDEVAIARCSIAELLEKDGDLDGAEAQLAEVAADDDTASAADAALRLGVLRDEHEDFDGALEAFDRAASVGNETEAALATAYTAALLAKRGETDLAKQAYERAIVSGVAEVQARAALELGNLLRDTGDEAGAKAAYEQALAFDDPDISPRVYQEMGAETAELRAYRLMAANDVEGAREAITEHFGSQRVADFWCAAWADLTAAAQVLTEVTGDDLWTCTKLALDFGTSVEDPAEARAYFRMAADHGHPELAPTGLLRLGHLAEEQRENAIALTWYRRAVADSEPGAQAGVLLAQLLSRLNDVEGAKAASRRAFATGTSIPALDAGVLLGQLHHESGDPVEARRVWEQAEAAAESPEQFGDALHRRIAQIGETADESDELLHRASRSDHPSTAINAMLWLGERAVQADDLDAAVRWFGEAAALDVPEQSEAARSRLANMLLAQGDRDAARIEYERVSRSATPDIAARGELGIGMIRHEEGDLPGAVAAYVKAAGRAVHEGLAEDAVHGARVVLEQQHSGGDHRAAADTLRRLAEVVPERDVAEWAYEAGTEFLGAEDTDSALVYLRCAVEIGAPEPDPAAVLALGETLQRRDDLAGARQAYERVLASGDERAAALAKYRLVALLGEDDPAAAEELMQRPDEVLNPAMKLMLGLKRQDEGDATGAIEMFREAADSADEQFSPMAVYALAQSLRREGEVEQARETYRQLVEAAPHDHYAGQALLELAAIAYHAEDDEEARAWNVRAWESDDPDLSAKAAMNLGLIAKRRRDVEAATPWFQALIDLGHPSAALAAAHLAELHYWREEHAEAARHYGYTLANTEDSELIAEAAYRVGEFHYQRGDLNAAREFLDRAVRTEDEAFAAQANTLLARLG
ncbi:Tetratricopeptide repeat-containing protein [Saccharopolyspora antimicrobica]|uniref:Tetratricopeptide repeat protein n=1 Tax=Saccharopolyspora antimicrobica TaxID=455193 RepID=A0A1I5J6X1_9PSEU|nr:tetratricopeptide repeat protein [Saccharopolyspora antimicrobica]RKT82053.1 tetratricopeptide repeat protein [Saccharopolyspora antimicrobica]SFO68370.1 Tetratricopeptide repeat-containing protein [Saccharopolyspora antimicrobica]